VAAEANEPGHTIELAKKINKMSDIKFKVCVLGHVQRGGSPTAYDRKIASLMGVKAVEALRDGLTNQMVAIQKDEIVLIDFPLTGDTTRYFSREDLIQKNDEILCA